MLSVRPYMFTLIRSARTRQLIGLICLEEPRLLRSLFSGCIGLVARLRRRLLVRDSRETFCVEMVCSCEAMINITIDGGDTTPGWFLVYRFANAHVDCGYMTGGSSDKADIDADTA